MQSSLVDDRAPSLPSLLVAILFWAGNFPLGKLALNELGPLTLTGARALLAAPLLRPMARPSRHPCNGLSYDATYWGQAHTTALNEGIPGAATPIFVAIGVALLLRDRLQGVGGGARLLRLQSR